MSETPREIVEQTIRDRRTTKVMAEQPLPSNEGSIDWASLLETASWAPFHRPAHTSHQAASELNGIFPWRFYVLEASECRLLRAKLAEKECGKIRDMLAAAELLIQATWLPNPPEQSVEGELLMFEPSLENMEHLAAASAAVQNLLIAATARNIPNYWSSGGILRTPEVLQWMNIPAEEILLGSIFLFPATSTEQTTEAYSKLREMRPPLSAWSRKVELASS